MPSNTIIFGTDYSAASQEALRVATMLAHKSQCKLLIAHISEHELYPVGEAFDEEPEPDPHELAELQKVVPTDAGVEYEHRLVHAAPTSKNVRPADEMIKLAKECDAMAIVVGTHGRSGLSRLMAGSVAESIIQHAPCMVVGVKPASS